MLVRYNGYELNLFCAVDRVWISSRIGNKIHTMLTLDVHKPEQSVDHQEIVGCARQHPKDKHNQVIAKREAYKKFREELGYRVLPRSVRLKVWEMVECFMGKRKRSEVEGYVPAKKPPIEGIPNAVKGTKLTLYPVEPATKDRQEPAIATTMDSTSKPPKLKSKSLEEFENEKEE